MPGMSKVRERMPIICDGKNRSLASSIRGEGEKRKKGQTFEARAEGSAVVPKREVAFVRSISLTFW